MATGTSTDCKSCTKKTRKEKVLVISAIDDISKISFSIIPIYTGIIIRLPQLSEQERNNWQRLIIKDYKACGCTTGTWFFAAGFVYTIAFALMTIKTILSDPLIYVSKGFALLVIAAIAGKLVGLAWSKTRLWINKIKLRKLITDRLANGQLAGIYMI